MKIVFMGTPEFAVASLDAINKVHEVVGVVTVADKPAGRGKKIRFSAVKEYALENNLLLLQPEKLKDEGFVNSFKELVSLSSLYLKNRTVENNIMGVVINQSKYLRGVIDLISLRPLII